MPCYIGDSEKDYWANLEASIHLERLEVPCPNQTRANEVLCNLCSHLSLSELTDKKINDWYLKHLFKDGEREPMRVVNEILRLYK